MIKYFSVMFIESVLTERFKIGDDGDRMVRSLLDHPVNLAPFSGEWIKLEDLIKVDKAAIIVATA